MSYPPPPIQPFERFQPTDGLLIRAEHWVRSHAYHRQRQNLHYQALHQPGIVCGLGVRPIDAPGDIAVEFRDRRWLQIEPGVAIDVFGNPIVVAEPIPYRISVTLPPAGAVTVYLVISHVDPETLHRKQAGEFLQETFRLDEKLNPPTEHELELCRIQLQAGMPALDAPQDVLFPGINQLDLRHRLSIGGRSQGWVRLAQGLYSDPASDRNLDSLKGLLESTQALYPALQGSPDIDRVQLNTADPLNSYDLVYVTGEAALGLKSADVDKIQRYLASGGVIVIDTPPKGLELAKSTLALAERLRIGLKPFDQLPLHHPLRRKPFLFPSLPKIHQNPLRLVAGDGLIMGSFLATGWGFEADPPLSRETVRTAQELGINLLHYAWQRRHLTTLLGSNTLNAAPLPSVPNPLQPPPPPPLPPATAPVVATDKGSVFDQFI